MKAPGFVARWRTFLRIIRGTEPARLIQRQPDQDRARQHAVARAVFLSEQSACGRVLSGPIHGDIR